MPVQRVVKDTIKKYKIPVTIFMGAFDKIIPPSLARNFIKGLDTAKLVVLEKGHRVFDQDNAQLISGYLLK
jgi:pimeloyl-ACP methyl ester carboxylesterase